MGLTYAGHRNVISEATRKILQPGTRKMSKGTEGGLLGAEEYKARPRNALSGRFICPPFTVMNAREGWWQERKRAWISIGIRSELGRGENLLKFSDSVMAAQKGLTWGVKDPDEMRHKEGKKSGAKDANPVDDATALRMMVGPNATPERIAKAKEKLALEKAGSFVKAGKSAYLLPPTEDGEGALTGTSIFDPVLCEISYRWYCPEGGHVLDPFSGGSVRGIVAGELGLRYTGVDLSKSQVEANRKQVPDIGTKLEPLWINGDSTDIVRLTAKHDADTNGYDMIFSCPPYGHLEVYSDDPKDISAMSVEAFTEAYFKIIAESCKLLKPNRFAMFVVGDYRDSDGFYCNLPAKTIVAFEEAGLRLYNEAILVTAIGSLPMRINKQFLGSRKLGKTHQSLLVFTNGQPKDFVKTWPGSLLDKEIK